MKRNVYAFINKFIIVNLSIFYFSRKQMLKTLVKFHFLRITPSLKTNNYII